MNHSPSPADELTLRSRRTGARSWIPAAAFGLAALGGLSCLSILVASVGGEHAPARAQADAAIASPSDSAWLLDPTPSLGAEALKPWRDDPPRPAFQLAAIQPEALAEPPSPPQGQERAQPSESLTDPLTTQSIETVPLPVRRPAELRSPNPKQPSLVDRQISRRTKAAAVPAASEDNRTFFEKLFGVQQQPSGPALAYAALDRNPVDTASPERRLGPAPAAGAGTAVYDISARTVYMPNGERLEAHSGLGETMDDPRYVHMRMRGATPPGTYHLAEREALFHGVRALRLHPVGGSAAIYGRAGLLAHSYLLGPSGASNGCVSFNDYNRFLQAYLRGEVRRLVVVSGRGQDGLPGLANKLFGISSPPASRGDT